MNEGDDDNGSGRLGDPSLPCGAFIGSAVLPRPTGHRGQSLSLKKVL